MSEYNKKYVDSTNNLANITGQNDLAKGYENGLKEVIRLKLDEYGYELEEIELDGSEISNIKIKEKNSNNIKKEDIQSKEDEDTQVFKEKEKNEQLKDDLIKILDISIETIQID
jgi:stage III sporulation protein AF